MALDHKVFLVEKSFLEQFVPESVGQSYPCPHKLQAQFEYVTNAQKPKTFLVGLLVQDFGPYHLILRVSIYEQSGSKTYAALWNGIVHKHLKAQLAPEEGRVIREPNKVRILRGFDEDFDLQYVTFHYVDYDEVEKLLQWRESGEEFWIYHGDVYGVNMNGDPRRKDHPTADTLIAHALDDDLDYDVRGLDYLVLPDNSPLPKRCTLNALRFEYHWVDFGRHGFVRLGETFPNEDEHFHKCATFAEVMLLANSERVENTDDITSTFSYLHPTVKGSPFPEYQPGDYVQVTRGYGEREKLNDLVGQVISVRGNILELKFLDYFTETLRITEVDTPDL